jgi:hypothetical protein
MKSSMRFDLVDLRLFLMVVEAASITHSAARAGMAAQAMRPSIRPRDDVSRSRRTFLPILRRPRFVPLSPPASLGLALLAGSLPARGAVSIQRMASTCAVVGVSLRPIRLACQAQQGGRAGKVGRSRRRPNSDIQRPDRGIRFALDSPLEEDGFELSVPR